MPRVPPSFVTFHVIAGASLGGGCAGGLGERRIEKSIRSSLTCLQLHKCHHCMSIRNAPKISTKMTAWMRTSACIPRPQSKHRSRKFPPSGIRDGKRRSAEYVDCSKWNHQSHSEFFEVFDTVAIWGICARNVGNCGMCKVNDNLATLGIRDHNM